MLYVLQQNDGDNNAFINPFKSIFIYFINERETATHPCRHHNQFLEGGDECVEYESY